MLVEALRYCKAVPLIASLWKSDFPGYSALCIRVVMAFVQDRNTDWIMQTDIS
jgi:hypothetical protein